MSSSYEPTHTVAHILCCLCGTPIEPNSANTCLPCIQSRVDITEGIPRQISLQCCRGCGRFSQPPAQWLPCEPESRELMALFLRRLKGLNKVRLVDANFVWTEPHSKRIKVKVTIQKEVLSGTVLQQAFVVEAVVANQQCNDCARTEAKNTWRAVVQVRQKVSHKRTFLYLEQVILKHQAHRQTNNIKTTRDGLDFFFDQRNHALRFVDFLATVVPIRSKSSEQLITQDIHSGDSTYKFAFSVELVPICKDDLVLLYPRSLAQSLGNLPPLVLCERVTTMLHFVDPNSLQRGEMQSSVYWRSPFLSLLSHSDLTQFIVLDIESTGRAQGKHLLADATVAKASDFGKSAETFTVRTHLGNILRPGDMCYGYDLHSANLNDRLDQQLHAANEELPDVILVRKSYEHLRRNRRRRRPWRLASLPKEEELVDAKDDGKAEMEYESFLEEIEEDAEMRAQMNLYRSQGIEEVTTINGDEVPRVPLEELLEDLHLNDE